MKAKVVLFTAMLSVNLFGAQFKHFKLKGNLRAKAKVSNGSFSIMQIPGAPRPMTPVLEAIKEYVSDRYQMIVSEKIQSMEKHNNSFDLGHKNYSNMNWQKPFGSFDLQSIRIISPDLFDLNRWIVEDALTITIDAKTYLEQLKKQGSVQISSSELKAFAGIQFKRVYRYIHFSSSYKEGLMSDPSKLFLNFLFFRPSHMGNMNEYEIMSKEDFLTTEGGFYAGLPLQYGFKVQAGGRLNYERMSELVIQKLGREDLKTGNEVLRMTFIKEKGKQVSAGLSLNVDFLNLLKITLLSFDLQYEYSEETSMHLDLLAEDINSDDVDLKREFNQIFSLNVFEPEILVKRIVSEESRINENYTSRYSSLFAAGSTSSSSQKVRIKQNGQSAIFLNLRDETVRERRSMWAGLINDFINSITELPMHLDEAIESVRNKISLDYETHSAGNSEDFIKNKNISFQMNHEFRAQVTDHSFFKNTKQRAVDFLYKSTTLDMDIISAFKTDTLKGPLRVISQVNISNPGILYLLDISKENFTNALHTICNYREPIEWEMDKEKSSSLDQSSECVVEILGAYKDLKNLSNLYMQASERYKKFAQVLQEHISSISHYITLFGEENIKINGSFYARTATGQNFQTYFMMGNSRSRGVIADHSLIPSN
jgi:hypothetical protein